MPSRAVAVVGVLTLATALLLTACTVGASNPPALVIAGSQPANPIPNGPAGPKSLPPLEEPRSTTIGWSDCADPTRLRLGPPAPPADLVFQCANIIGPLDNTDDPTSGLTRVSLLKVGSGPTPLLVLNDLDGLPGTLYAARLAAQLSPRLLRTFSLIGMDRRGTGLSDGVHCVPQQDRNQMIDADPAEPTDLNALLDASHDGSQQCVLELDTRLANLDTEHTAADLELVRQQLGAKYLDAIGHGEGSRVLMVYAQRHPAQVGRFVLDGVPDPTLDSVDAARARSAAATATFQAFQSDCADNGGCQLGTDVATPLRQLLSQLRVNPLSSPDGQRLTAGAALYAVREGLSDRSRWPTLAQAIQQALGGDGSGLIALIAPTTTGTNYDPARLDADLAAGCNDTPDRASPGQVADAIKEFTAQQPLFGGLYAQDLLLCAPWPVPIQALPKPSAPNAPPILVLSTANDPVTPQAGTQRSAAALASAVVVNWAGAGHGALGYSACAGVATEHFLVDGRVPQDSTACPP